MLAQVTKTLRTHSILRICGHRARLMVSRFSQVINRYGSRGTIQDREASKHTVSTDVPQGVQTQNFSKSAPSMPPRMNLLTPRILKTTDAMRLDGFSPMNTASVMLMPTVLKRRTQRIHLLRTKTRAASGKLLWRPQASHHLRRM